MKRTLFFLLFFLPFLSLGQKRSLVVTGVVYEEHDKTSTNDTLLKDVKVYFENSSVPKVLTNRHGKFYITLPDCNPDNPPTLVVESVFHDLYKYKLSRAEVKRNCGDTLFLKVKLDFKTLTTFSVSAAPQKVHGTQEYHVSDYEVMGENLLLLVNEKRLEKGSKLVYSNKEGMALSSYTIPDVAKEFFTDYAGRVFLVCTTNVYAVTIRDEVIALKKVESKYFERQVKPWVDTTDNQAYFTNAVWYYPEFDYYVYNMEDSTYTRLHTVIDKPLMELYRAQYKYVDGRDKIEARKAERETGIDKEIWIAIWSGFPNSIYYNELYAPMFIQNDTAIIFDHYKNKIFRYNKLNEPIDSIDISYHKGPDKREWENVLIEDRILGKIYALYERNGISYLKELNTSTGEIVKVYALTYKYPERIKVYDGYVYYLYRPFESVQKKYLYREKLEK
jgi:hypothetical protein